MILAGDIGGTTSRLGLFEKTVTGFRVLSENLFPSSEYQNLTDIVAEFSAKNSNAINCACFGVPGPVRGETAKLQNLPWIVDARELGKILGHKRTALINDLEANAYGLNELKDDEFFTLNEGTANVQGNRAVISAGTGLGEAGIYNDNGELRPFATEGGHADFAPRSELEIELLRYLLPKFGRVSVERVVSGNGLRNIFEFLRDTKRAVEPVWLAEEIKFKADFGAVIANHGLDGKSAICEQTLDVFVSLYAAAAGNLALRTMATGGVFIGGGIAPKISPKLKERTFLESFAAKGRMRELLEQIPVRVILNDRAALIGAAHFAYYKILS